MQPVYPFSAIVGQEMLQRGLLLGVIQPALGGVLVRGTKGVAKSTAVRALARLLPPIETLAGCPFQRCPGEIIPGWPLADATVVSRPAPLVELPLGASEDRVLGSIHLERALRGERVFEPGLLAAANRGILYIDEVNLLPDHLVDVLLDAAAGGIHRLERDGLSVVHPARFLLIGTMNPEEGELRPQLLDRFGLAVDVCDLADPRLRSEAVRRRLDFEADPPGFTDRWQPADALLARRIVDARRLLPQVTINDGLVASISQHCLAAGVDGLRADLTVARAACAWAAFHGRLEVEASDIDAVADLALAHRRRDPPRTPPDRRAGDHEHRRDNHGADSVDVTFSGNAPGQGTRSEITIDDIAGVYEAAVRPPPLSDSVIPGRNRDAGTCISGRGAQLQPTSRVAWGEMVRAAALEQNARGRTDAAGPMILRPEDLRYRRQQGRTGCLRLFVIDASGSMAAWRRMRRTKAAVLALLRQGSQFRDRAAILAFRGTDSELILRPVRGVAVARQALASLPAGGTTPLALGLSAARRFILTQRRRQPAVPIWTVIFTDGRANVGIAPHPLESPSHPWKDALHQACLLSRCASEFLVVDTEVAWPRSGQARALADAMACPLVTVEQVLARPLVNQVRGAAS